MAKRILHVIATLPVGGAEQVLLTTLRLLSSAYQSLVCCLQHQGALGSAVQALGVPVIELHRLKSGGWDGAIVDDLVALIKHHQIDLVHGHLYHANLYGRFAAHRAGIPAVISVHNTYTQRKWHRQFLNWYWGRRSARIIAVSDAIRNDIITYDHVARERVVTILNGIDLARSQATLTRDQARARLGLPKDVPVLITIGRLVEQKGHAILLDALALLAQAIHAVFVGDGVLRCQLESQAKTLGLEQYIHFLGTRSDIAELLRAADLYVMPSLWEGLGLALLEAMAAKLPVIASRVGGMIEVLRDGADGYLVPPGDAPALAQGLANLLADPARMQHFAAASWQRVQHFDAQTMVAAIEKVYQEILASD